MIMGESDRQSLPSSANDFDDWQRTESNAFTPSMADLLIDNRCTKQTLETCLEFKRILEHMFSNPQVAHMTATQMINLYKTHYFEFRQKYNVFRRAFSNRLSSGVERLDDPCLSKCLNAKCELSPNCSKPDNDLVMSESEAITDDASCWLQISPKLDRHTTSTPHSLARTTQSTNGSTDQQISEQVKTAECDAQQNDQQEANRQEDTLHLPSHQTQRDAPDIDRKEMVVNVAKCLDAQDNVVTGDSTQKLIPLHSNSIEDTMAEYVQSIATTSVEAHCNEEADGQLARKRSRISTSSDGERADLDDRVASRLSMNESLQAADASPPEASVLVHCHVLDCDAVFENERDAKQHFNAHDKLFKCSVCSALFTTKSSVFKHFLVHNGVKSKADISDSDSHSSMPQL